MCVHRSEGLNRDIEMRRKREERDNHWYIDHYIPPPLPYGWGGAAPGGNAKFVEL